MVSLQDIRFHSKIYNKLLNFKAQYIVCLDRD
jgi:hypothetical protein